MDPSRVFNETGGGGLEERIGEDTNRGPHGLNVFELLNPVLGMGLDILRLTSIPIPYTLVSLQCCRQIVQY